MERPFKGGTRSGQVSKIQKLQASSFLQALAYFRDVWQARKSISNQSIIQNIAASRDKERDTKQTIVDIWWIFYRNSIQI